MTLDITGDYSERSTRRLGTSSRDGNGLRGNGTITADNPWFRAIGAETEQRVLFNFSSLAGDALLNPQRFTSMAITPSIALTIGQDWQLKLSANYGRSTNMLANRMVDNAAIEHALQARTLDARRQNFGEVDIAGLDFNIGYGDPLGAGDFTVDLGGTYGLIRKKIAPRPICHRQTNYRSAADIQA